jgi:hypothetical protein
MSWDVLADADLLCEKVSVLTVMIKGRPCTLGNLMFSLPVNTMN